MKRETRTISDSDLRDILNFPRKNSRGNQYICSCPFCGKEDHFYISVQTQEWDCKKCGESGQIFKLLKQLDKTFLLKGKTIEDREIITSLINLINEEEKEEIQEEIGDLPTISMPAGWKVYDKITPYLLSRRITLEDCQRYHIGATTLFKKYEKYLLIPIFDNKKIKGFVGRYSDKNVPKNALRYNNSKATEFSKLLFGYDEITANTVTVILVEGIFDKIAVDKFLNLWDGEEIKCVSTFGKKISKEQNLKLRQKGVTNVVLLYDFDAIKEIKKYALELENFFSTTITYTTKKDIDECEKEEALRVFQNLQKPQRFIYDVIGKIK